MLQTQEAYQLLFSDSLFSALLFPFDNELIFDVMVYFGGYETYEITAVATLASMLGFALNYAAGRGVYFCRNYAHLSVEEEKKFQTVSHYAQKYGSYLLLLNFHFVFGPVATFIAGMLNIRPLMFLALTLIGRVGYYFYFLGTGH